MQCRLTKERFEEVNKTGNIRDFIQKASNEIGCSKAFVNEVLPLTFQILTSTQKTVFKLFYYEKQSIYEIKYKIGYYSITDVERRLKAAEKKLIREIKLIYKEG